MCSSMAGLASSPSFAKHNKQNLPVWSWAAVSFWGKEGTSMYFPSHFVRNPSSLRGYLRCIDLSHAWFSGSSRKKHFSLREAERMLFPST